MTRFRTYKIATPPETKVTSKDDIKGFVSLKFLRLWYRETHEIFSFKGENSCKGSMTEREMLVYVVVDVLPQHW